jgi:WD40 repeat protein
MTPEGELVLTLSKDGTSRCWSSFSGDCLRVLPGHTDAVCSGSLDARGSLLATFSLDNSVRLWTLDSGLCKAVFPLTAEVACTKLSPLGTRLAVAYADWSVDIFSLDAENLQPTRLNGHSGDVTGLAFSADDTILASCSSDCCCIVWDSTSGERRGVFSGDCALTSCHLDSVSERLVLGTSRGEVHFLRAEV